MEYFDRLTGTTVSSLEPPLLQGRWLLADSADVKMNAAPAERGDYVTPAFSSKHATLRFSQDGRDRRQPLSFVDESIPGGWSGPRSEWPPLASALDDLQADWRPLLEATSSWENIAASVPPVDPRLSEELHLFDLEKELKERLVHLQTVCQSPREQLETVTERVPVGRARKLSSRASEHLAAHPEDWEHRSLFALVPRHVLSEMPEENLNIYENRVAARLIDRLERYLRMRIRRVRTLQKTLQVAHDFTSDVRNGSPVFIERVTRLWGEAFELDTGEEMRNAQDTLETLLRLRKSLQRLHRSKLYDAVPRTAPVEDQLEPTNLLTEHQHYRHVGLLWRHLLQTEEGAPEPNEHHQKMQGLAQAYEAFTLMLVCRTLYDRGFVPDSSANSSSLRRGQAGLRLLKEAHPDATVIRVRWTEEGFITLKSPNWGTPLQFTPLPGYAAALPSPFPPFWDGITANHQRGDDASPGESVRVLVHPGSRDENEPPATGTGAATSSTDSRSRREADGHANDEKSKNNPGGHTGMVSPAVQVSPQDILSQERIGQTVHKWLDGSRFLRYPLSMASRRPMRQFLLESGDWTSEGTEPREIFVHRMPSAEEEARLEEKIDAKKAELERDGQVSPFVSMVDEHRERLEMLFSELAWLRTCPICNSITSPRLFEARDHTFACMCQMRGCEWGLNLCGECSRPYPYVIPPGFQGAIDQTEEPASADQLIRHFGRDLITPTGANGDVTCPFC